MRPGVVCDYSGHPFQAELSRALAARGHAVLHLHFAAFETPKGRLSTLPGDPSGFAVEGLDISRRFDKRNFVRRRFWEGEFGGVAAARAIAFRPDVVVGCNMPLDAQRRFQAACARHGIAFVFWLQDIYSRAIHHYLGQKLGFVGRLIGRFYMRLERRLLRSSDAVIAISERFLPVLAAWRVDGAAIDVIPNWASLDDIRPVGKANDWAMRHGLSDKLVALYSGTLGLKHAPALLWDLAQATAGAGLHIVVVSAGPGIDWLGERQRQTPLANLTLLPFQPMEAYAEVLGAADIAVAMIDKEAGGFSVPSKILSYLAAGKPVVASMPLDNDAAVMIRRCDCGVVVPAGDAVGFCNAVLALATDAARRAECASNARRFAEAHFDIERIADRFEDVFARARRRADLSKDGQGLPKRSLAAGTKL
jgi:glycosyltransferase involved in cell wall biosynthesis